MMKTVFFLFFFTISLGLMAQSKKPVKKSVAKPAIVYDCPAMKSKYDSMSMALKLANFRLNRIRVYLAICDKHPVDNKFLKGWVKRALQ